METKLPEDQVKSVLAPWKFSWRSSGFKNRLVTALELYEHFPLDIVVTGGTKSANARLASAVCGLKDELEEEETDEDEDSDEQEDDKEVDDGSSDGSVDLSSKASFKTKSIVRFTDDFAEDGLDPAPMLFYPQIPNVRILTTQESSSPAQDTYDVLVVLTTELHQEDHTKFAMEQWEKNKPLYLVKAEQEMDLVYEKLTGPCKTCAWERMRARTLEFQKKYKEEFESAQNAEHLQTPQGLTLQHGTKLWEPEEIAGVLKNDIPNLRKKAFSQFLMDLTTKLRGPRTEICGTGTLTSSAFKDSKISQEDLGKISAVFQYQDLTDDPSKLLSIFNALEYFRLDVGLLGETGCGSSSLFNTLLNLRNGDKEASPTGVFETTKKPVTHPYPEYHKVLLWDLPGLGRVEDFKPAATGSTLYQVPPIPPCDVYILVSPLRLNLGYIQVVKHLLSEGKPCYVVLSKADLIEEQVIEEVRKWNEEMLEKLGLKQDIYVVSALHPETLDLPKLRRTFNDALEGHKRVALANYVAKLLEEDVFWKRGNVCKIN